MRKLRRWLKIDAWAVYEILPRVSSEEIGAAIRIVLNGPLPGAKLEADEAEAEYASIARANGMSAQHWRRIRPNVLMLLAAFNGAVFTQDQGSREHIPAELRAYVLRRDGYACRYCGSDDGALHVDHIHPVVHGGDNHPDNLAAACGPCNLSKGSKSLAEWRDNPGVSL